MNDSEQSMPRDRRALVVYWLALVPLAWLGMMTVHELGHVLLAWGTGGRVSQVILHPLALSRTDLARNPAPLWVAWGGPLVGSALPVLVWGVLRWRRARTAAVARAFAGFCLVANGAYLGLATAPRIGDAGDLLKYGAPAWALYGVGLLAFSGGLALWHGQAKHFGYGPAPHPIGWRQAWTALAFLALAVLLCHTLSAPA